MLYLQFGSILDSTNTVQFCSVTHSCPTLCNPMDCSMPDLAEPHHVLKFMSNASVMPSGHFIITLKNIELENSIRLQDLL